MNNEALLRMEGGVAGRVPFGRIAIVGSGETGSGETGSAGKPGQRPLGETGSETFMMRRKPSLTRFSR